MNNKYTIIKQESIEELNGTGYLLKHNKTGARVVVVSNEDDNKVFQIGFRTPPKDDTGVPHILEHSVLCGSREFPMKAPFVELVSAITRSISPQNQNQDLKRSRLFLPKRHLTQKQN